MPRAALHALLLVAGALYFLASPGCGRSSAKQMVKRAEAGVEKALDAWARGESPEKFASSSSPIQATDPDWSAGHRLLSSLIAETKQSQERPEQVRCRVTLNLQDREGRKVDKEVWYDVQVGSRITIARAP